MSPWMQPVCINCCRVATVIDDLIDRVMADDRLNANPRVCAARTRLPKGFAPQSYGLAGPCSNPLVRTHTGYKESWP